MNMLCKITLIPVLWLVIRSGFKIIIWNFLRSQRKVSREMYISNYCTYFRLKYLSISHLLISHFFLVKKKFIHLPMMRVIQK